MFTSGVGTNYLSETSNPSANWYAGKLGSDEYVVQPTNLEPYYGGKLVKLDWDYYGLQIMLKRLARLVRGQRPTMLDASKANEIIDAINALQNITIRTAKALRQRLALRVLIFM